MANLHDIRRRIKSVKNTAQITRAMQLVAASKMKRAQDAALASLPYSELLARILAPISKGVVNFSHPFLEAGRSNTRCIILLSTDRGLCGALNANLFRELPDRAQEVKYITVGRKAAQFISRTQRILVADFILPDAFKISEARKVIDFAIQAFEDGSVGSVDVLYPRFVNTLRQVSELVPLLPLAGISKVLESLGIEKGAQDDRELNFEPSAEVILTDLLPLYVRRQFYAMVRATKASEHSARMVAMKTATDNANNLADNLTLDYNKARQAAITQEILEIAAATAANEN